MEILLYNKAFCKELDLVLRLIPGEPHKNSLSCLFDNIGPVLSSVKGEKVGIEYFRGILDELSEWGFTREERLSPKIDNPNTVLYFRTFAGYLRTFEESNFLTQYKKAWRNEVWKNIVSWANLVIALAALLISLYAATRPM